MFVLDQAADAKIYDIQDRCPGKRFGFSHLYTALTRPGYREYLGLRQNGVPTNQNRTRYQRRTSKI